MKVREEMWREVVEEKVGDLRDPEWRLICDENYVDELENEDEDVDEVLTRLKTKLARWRSTYDRKDAQAATSITEPLKTRALIVSKLVAAVAGNDQDVQRFRAHNLDGRLLAPDEVEGWITRNTQARTTWLEVPLPDGSEIDIDPQGAISVTPSFTISSRRRARGITLRKRAVAYAKDGERHLAMTTMGGPLEWLRQLSESLARRYGWEDAQATTFVLTGATPWLSPIRSRSRINLTVPAATRVVLEIDPSVSPEDVADAYRNARRAALGRRPRAISEKHLRLAEFSLRLPDQTMAARLAAWNEAFPDWAYSNSGNFVRDVRVAVRRLVNADIQDEED